MVRVQERTLGILEGATAVGRHETALRAIREARGNLEFIAKLEGLLKEQDEIPNMLDLCKLSAEDLGMLLRAW